MPVVHRRSLGATRVMPTSVQLDVSSRLIPHKQIQLMLAPLDALPSLPAVAVRLIETTGSTATDLDSLVELVESDSHLSAAVATLARQGGVHAGGERVGVREALRSLGSHRVRNAILSAYLYRVLLSIDVDSASTWDREAYWKHSVAVAWAAELLADALVRPRVPVDAFVGGLLHDIGKPALAATLPKSYARVLDVVGRQGVCILDAEQATLGLDHTVAGRRLAVLWKLPRRVVESIRLHHQLPDDLPESLESPLTVRIVHLADRLVGQEGIGCCGCAQPVSVDGPADWLGIEPAVLEGIRRMLPSRIEQALQWMTVVDPHVAASSSPATSVDSSELLRSTTLLVEANRGLQAGHARRVREQALGMVATMAAGAAHELNNPLAVISGRAQLLLMDSTIPPDRRKSLEAIHAHCDKCSQIVNDLMDFAKPPPPQPSVVRVADVVQSLRSRFLADASLSPDQIAVELHDASATIFADAAQVGDALQAILINALEAVEPGKALQITINSRTGGSDDTVVVAIEDSGCGMSAEVLAHALDPFFSYRSAGRGRGLGLSRAYRLIEANGGDLSLESRPGQGTRVEIRLPVRRRVADAD